MFGDKIFVLVRWLTGDCEYIQSVFLGFNQKNFNPEVISYLVVPLVTQRGQQSEPFANKCFFRFSKLCCVFSHPSVFYFLTPLRSYSHIYHSIP